MLELSVSRDKQEKEELKSSDVDLQSKWHQRSARLEPLP